jgi:hypothetical protein
VLSGNTGRPNGLKDGPCLARLAAVGLALAREDGRFEVSGTGARRHRREVLKQPVPSA